MYVPVLCNIMYQYYVNEQKPNNEPNSTLVNDFNINLNDTVSFLEKFI